MSEGVNPKDLLGIKKAPLRLVPPALLIEVAPVMALGAAKYGPYNWRDYPVKLSVYLEAIQRHLAAFQDGEDLDPESGRPHTAHAAACLAIIFDAAAIGQLIDDRPKAGGAASLLAAQDASKVPQEDLRTFYARELADVASRTDWEDGVEPSDQWTEVDCS